MAAKVLIKGANSVAVAGAKTTTKNEAEKAERRQRLITMMMMEVRKRFRWLPRTSEVRERISFRVEIVVRQ